MTQRLLLRADARAALGTGHVFRCLALAEAARAAGGAALLLTQALPPGLAVHSAAAGCTVLDLPHAAGSAEDAAALLAAAERFGATALVLDGAHFDAGYRARLARRAAPLAVLCDAPEQYAGAADLLVDPNFEALPLERPALIGPRYWPLRAAFAVAAQPAAREGTLVGFGGSDPAGLGAPAARALQAIGTEPVTLLQGPAAPPPPPGLCVLHNVADMAGLLRRQRRIVAAMGNLAVEALACRCTLVGIGIHPGQSAMLAAIAREPGVEAVLDLALVPAERRADRLTAFLQALPPPPPGGAPASALDGQGAGRILAALAGCAVSTRKACPCP